MSRYRGPRLRVTRRLGELPGLTRKASKKSNPPGRTAKPVASDQNMQFV